MQLRTHTNMGDFCLCNMLSQDNTKSLWHRRLWIDFILLYQKKSHAKEALKMINDSKSQWGNI